MRDMIAMIHTHLSEAGYSIGRFRSTDGVVTTFEGDTILGFIFHYPDPDTLIAKWRRSSDLVLKEAQFLLRQAEAKAWNTYLVFLADTAADAHQQVVLDMIEENLVGTRKIARAGVSNSGMLREALLSLLPIQNAPHLEAVDMVSEIRLRTSELPSDVIDAFLSDIPEAILLQMLERSQ